MKVQRHKSAAGAEQAINAMLPETTLPLPPELAAFVDERIAHQKYKDAYKRTMELVRAQQPERLIIVGGPTGAGKSSLAKSVFEAINELARKAGASSAFIPAVLLGAVINGAPFNWKDFLIRALVELHEPLVGPGQQLPFDVDAQLRAYFGKTPGEAMEPHALRRRLEYALRRRRTSVLIIDEAHHMLIGLEGRELARQFETIKSLAQMTGVTIVLVGTYELLAIRELSSQLIRRSEIVHLGRYNLWQQEGKGYQELVEFLAGKCPVPLADDVLADLSFLYQYDLGTAGLLHRLLVDSASEAMAKKKSHITRDIITSKAKDPESLETLLRDIVLGERRMHHSSRERINQLLLMPPSEAAEEFTRAANDEDGAGKANGQPSKGGKRPGLPKNGPVGRKAAGLTRAIDAEPKADS